MTIRHSRLLSLTSSVDHPRLHSFPTRRSSDLARRGEPAVGRLVLVVGMMRDKDRRGILAVLTDRKSTRLNSSHPSNSYAVFCLKKKTTNHYRTQRMNRLSQASRITPPTSEATV